MAIHSCQTCGPTEVEVDDRMGHTVCVLCGSVIELNTIVSEVTFTDTGKGSSLADGFSVSSSSGLLLFFLILSSGEIFWQVRSHSYGRAGTSGTNDSKRASKDF